MDINWDLFIDDKPETIQQFIEAGISILVPARPWNEGVEAIRFFSWEDADEMIERAATE